MTDEQMFQGVLDCNALDLLIDTMGAVEALVEARRQGRIDLMYPHITAEEAAATTDSARRAQLTGALAMIARQVPSGAFVVGLSRLGQARLTSSDGSFDRLRSMNQTHLNNTRDALIASTAQAEGCALVTNENRLRNRARAEGIPVVSSLELLRIAGL